MQRQLDVCPDKFVKSKDVVGLSSCNFIQFLNVHDATMVMFYDPNVADCYCAAKNFAIAAKETQRSNHSYAAVDCTKEPELCKNNLAWTFPTFKVFIKVFPVTTVHDRPNLTASQLRQHLELAPPPPSSYRPWKTFERNY